MRRPVPASRIRLGSSPSRATATQDVCPPYRTNSGPGDGVEPLEPQIYRRTRGSLPILSAVASRKLLKGLAVDPVAARHGDLVLAEAPPHQPPLWGDRDALLGGAGQALGAEGSGGQASAHEEGARLGRRQGKGPGHGGQGGVQLGPAITLGPGMFAQKTGLLGALNTGNYTPFFPFGTSGANSRAAWTPISYGTPEKVSPTSKASPARL